MSDDRKSVVKVRLTDSDRMKLRRMAAALGWTQSETVRRAIQALQRELQRGA